MTSIKTFGHISVLVCAYLAALPNCLRAAQTPCGGPALEPAPFITLAWDVVAAAKSYVVEIHTNNQFPLAGRLSFNVGDRTTSTAGLINQIQVAGLQYATTYYWRLGSNFVDFWVSAPPTYDGSFCSFTTSAAPTQVPQAGPLQSVPSKDGTSLSTATTLRWNAYTGASNYEVQLSTNPTMTPVLTQQTSSLFWTPTTTITQGTTYYWRVRAQNANGWGSWTNSPIWRFDTESVSTQITFKVLLQGAMETTPLDPGMIDYLRSAQLIPTTNPYFWSPSFGYTWNRIEYPTLTPLAPFVKNYYLPNLNPNVLSASQLAVTGSAAIVDWVVVAARHGATNAPLGAWIMVVRKDGSVVQPDGTDLTVSLAMKNVKFSVHHRNHLAAMTANAVDAVGTPLTIDFTSTSTALYGTNPTYIVAGKRALWAGDCNGNGTVAYSGANNDRDKVLAAIGGIIPTSFLDGYLSEDVSMSGRVLYSGAGNDRDMILSVIGGVVPTNTRVQQIP